MRVTLGTVASMRTSSRLALFCALTTIVFGCESRPDPSTTTTTASATTASPAAPSGLSPLSPSAMADKPMQVPTAPAAETPTIIAAQHLLVAYKGAKSAPKTITRSKADAKKRAEEALAKAKKGDDFTALVSTYSDEPGAAARQGNLGKFTREAMVKPFSDAAFALKVGDISDVVETDFGFHVIKRNQ